MQFNTKLNIGDKIWFINSKVTEPRNTIITEIHIVYSPNIFHTRISYETTDGFSIADSEEGKTWFRTQDDLVNHLLQYLNPVVSPHVSTKETSGHTVCGCGAQCEVDLDDLHFLTQKEKEELDQIGARIMRAQDDQQCDNLYELLALLEKKVITPPEQKRRDDLLKTITESDENDLEEILGQPIKSVVQAQKDQDMVNLEELLTSLQKPYESEESKLIRGFAQKAKEEKKNELNQAFEDYLQNGSIPTKETIRKANNPVKAYKANQPVKDDLVEEFSKFFDAAKTDKPIPKLKTAEQIKMENEFEAFFSAPAKPKEKSLNQLFDELIGD